MKGLTTLLLLSAALLLAGCGGGGGASEDAGTIPDAAVGTIEDEVGGTPGPFQSAEFEPPISLTLPPGWRATEEFGMIQAFRGAGEAQAVTIESLGPGNLDERVEQMRATADLEATEPQEADLGGYEGLRFDAEPAYATTVEGSEYYALGQGPVRVWVMDVDGTLVAVFAESSVLRTERREAEQITADFFNEAQQVVDSIEFGGTAQGDGDGTGGDTDTEP